MPHDSHIEDGIQDDCLITFVKYQLKFILQKQFTTFLYMLMFGMLNLFGCYICILMYRDSNIEDGIQNVLQINFKLIFIESCILYFKKGFGMHNSLIFISFFCLLCTVTTISKMAARRHLEK